MGIEIRQKFHQLPTKRTLDIIRRASGKPRHEVEKFIKGMNTHESRKMNTSLKKSVLTKKEIKKLINDSAKQGLNINRDRLWGEFEKVKKEEKKRLIQYSKTRSKISQRVEKLTGRGSARDLMGDTENKTDALMERLGSLKEKSDQKTNSGQKNKNQDSEEKKNDENTPPPPKVIELPIG